MSHAGMAALVGSTELRGMVDPHVELVFAERALRHAATASATIFSTMLGRPELWRFRTCPARFLEAARSRSFRCRQSAGSRAVRRDGGNASGMQAELLRVLEDDPGSA